MSSDFPDTTSVSGYSVAATPKGGNKRFRKAKLARVVVRDSVRRPVTSMVQVALYVYGVDGFFGPKFGLKMGAACFF